MREAKQGNMQTHSRKKITHRAQTCPGTLKNGLSYHILEHKAFCKLFGGFGFLGCVQGFCVFSHLPPAFWGDGGEQYVMFLQISFVQLRIAINGLKTK
jgi:hypothetical protein